MDFQRGETEAERRPTPSSSQGGVPSRSPSSAALERETARKAHLLYRLLASMTALAILGATSALFEPSNRPGLTLTFYGAVLAVFGSVALIVRSGRVILAAWCCSIFFSVLIAFATLYFGGMQGQIASNFAAATLLIGTLVGARAALGVALASSLWCGFVVYLEVNDKLPPQLGHYSPFNAWTAMTIIVCLTAILLQVSLQSLSRAHAEAQKSAQERDEALQRSIQGQKMELVGNLTSGIAHDLNNLLTIIVGATSVLKRRADPDDRETEGLLEDLEGASSRAALIASQLLSFGRPPTTEVGPVNLSALVRSMGRMLPRLLGSMIVVRVTGEKELWTEASRAGLEQVLLNLAVNARDAMPTGGTLTFALDATDSEVILRASDTGSGMSPDVRRRIFEPFFTTKTTGTGLGLATVRQLMEHFGGSIDVESEPGRGTTFILKFPRTDAGAAHDRLLGIATPDGAISRPRPTRVLLVEDDPLVRRSLIRGLEQERYDVIAVADGEEAFALIQTAKDLDVVVTDINMPRLDGEQLSDRIQSVAPSLPVLLISGNRSPSPSTLRGPRAFLPKPATPQAVREAIEALLAEGPRSTDTA